MSLTLFFVPGLILNSRLFEISTNYYLNNFDLKEPTPYKCQKWTKSHTKKTNADICIYMYLYKHTFIYVYKNAYTQIQYIYIYTIL